MLACLALLLPGCASVPYDYPREASQAVPPSPANRLGATAAAWGAAHGEQSGFIGLGDGIDGLGARLRLIELAEATIDAQYFIIKRDRAGALFAGKLLLAADRGVRVRLLVDDIFTPGTDQAFSLLNTHPNVEVRLFNPVANRTFKYLSYAADFARANRRMHNKSFTADNSFTIVGGRNIGEEYFELKPDVKFDDYEVLAIGPVVEQVSAGFDAFWNSELSVPMEAFGLAVDPADLDAWRAYLQEQIDAGPTGIYARAVNSTLLTDIRERRVEPAIAGATLVTDSPDKLLAPVGDEDMVELGTEIGQRFRAADQEIIIVTPYFIPQEIGAQLIEDLLQRGVRVVIVTNSLASTNHVPVHSAYSRYRKRLLQAGAEIYEIRASGTVAESEWGHRPARVTLHSKATVIDRETVFIGSLNFDPRSILINTEMGLFIDNADVGEPFAELIMGSLPQVAYRVTVNDDDQLRWLYQQDGTRELLKKEPEASWWRRTQAMFYRLVPEGQL